MHVVYEAENLIDAHLIRGMIENQGIPAYVKGDLLTGGMGQLPVMGLVAVWVADPDAVAAARVIAVWREGGMRQTGDEVMDGDPEAA